MALRSDVGCVRTNNEDQIRFVEPHAGDPRAQRGVLLVVADGMGGHAAGEVASALAIETIYAQYYASTAEPTAALREAVQRANAEIHAASRTQPHLDGMGTTVTALLVRDHQGYVAHVGDSRLYLLRDGHLRQLSNDHSLVQEMVRRGALSAEDARHHEDRNVILRALGIQPTVDVETLASPLPLQVGDVFLVCSDGLHDLVADDELALALGDPDIQRSAEVLLARARSRGGTDNISLGILRLTPLDTAASDLRATREVAVVV